ncbi:MAG: internal scaffolding protein [Arizlama microvirus]|nr:MAG: internal scaffolding protein [Arizlama microvirus]
MSTPKFATHWENRIKVGLKNDKPGKTQQSGKEECDINNILKRYEKTGILPDMIKTDPRYGDFSSCPEYQEALNIVELANTQFNALDAHARRRFDNDPAKFLEFAENPANLGEMVKLGLATEIKPIPAPVETPKTEETKTEETKK